MYVLCPPDEASFTPERKSEEAVEEYGAQEEGEDDGELVNSNIVQDLAEDIERIHEMLQGKLSHEIHYKDLDLAHPSWVG